MRAVRAAGPAEKLVPLRFTGAGIPRQGNPVVAGGEVVGEVTAARSRRCSRSASGMAYVRAALADPGTEVEVDVRGKRRGAVVAEKPLYRTP